VIDQHTENITSLQLLLWASLLIENYVSVSIPMQRVGTTLARGCGSLQKGSKIYTKLTRQNKNGIPTRRGMLVNDEPMQYLINNSDCRSRHDRRCDTMAWRSQATFEGSTWTQRQGRSVGDDCGITQT